MIKKLALLAAPLVALAATPSHATQFIDFESEPDFTGPSVTVDDVTFSNGMGNVQIGSYPGSRGEPNQALFNLGSDPLLFQFDTDLQSIAFDFGHDNSITFGTPAMAMLTLFFHGTQTAQVGVALDQDSFLDQSVFFDAGVGSDGFNSATFEFVDASFQSSGLVEIVDNVSITGITRVAPPPPPAIPEPSTWLMIIMGLGLVGASMRARSSVSAASFA
ncbi:MAG: PEPxxWA-CTERM sorting domain-containing protein [Pseudomonadota bacterium]